MTVDYLFQLNSRLSPGNNKKDKATHQNDANNFPVNSRQYTECLNFDRLSSYWY